jgi:arylsulfatase A-like enzyme
MLTGQFSHMHGFTRNGQTYDNGKWNWVRAMGQAGYETALFGKWHLNATPKGTGIEDWKVLDDQGEYYNPDIITPEGRSVVEGYATDLITQYSLDWLKQGRDPDKPFALLIHHKAPHRNFMPALRYIQKYVGTNFPVPTNYSACAFRSGEGGPAMSWPQAPVPSQPRAAAVELSMGSQGARLRSSAAAQAKGSMAARPS